MGSDFRNTESKYECQQGKFFILLLFNSRLSLPTVIFIIMNKSPVELCKVPQTVKFNYQPDQEMHSSISLHNLKDTVVTYKIKTNKPGIYLVKPMEGQIPSHSTITVSFRRKELAIDNFNAIMNNPAQGRQKFLIQFTTEVEDSVGILQKIQQVAYMGVSFTKTENSQSKIQHVQIKQNSPDKVFTSENNSGNLSVKIDQKKQQLKELIVQRQKWQARSVSKGGSTFTMQDLINVLILAFLSGLVLV